MTENERDIIKDSLKLYKESINKEIHCSSLIIGWSSILNREARHLIKEIDDLIKKFDTMKWE